MFVFAVDEYRYSGRDVHMYDEDEADLDGSGAAYDEVVNAIQNRSVTEVAIMGYSHGGGSTYNLAWRLHQNSVAGSGVADITKPFTVPLTGYIDAIDDGGPTITPETRRPLLTQFHSAQYQDNNIPSGEPSNGDDDENRTYLGVIHTDIDDHPIVHRQLRDRLRQKVAR